MNKYLVIISYFFLTTMVSGCTTIYTTVMDERNVKTIASDTKIKGKTLDGLWSSVCLWELPHS